MNLPVMIIIIWFMPHLNRRNNYIQDELVRYANIFAISKNIYLYFIRHNIMFYKMHTRCVCKEQQAAHEAHV